MTILLGLLFAIEAPLLAESRGLILPRNPHPPSLDYHGNLLGALNSTRLFAPRLPNPWCDTAQRSMILTTALLPAPYHPRA